jgi:glycerol 3-phosphatase-2
VTASLASGYDLIIFDLDGVVYLGTQAIPGAPEAIETVIRAGSTVAYVTNNASRRAAEVADLLRSLGVPARPEEVLTSAAAAAELLAADLPAGSPVLVVGADSLHEELRAVGLKPVDHAPVDGAALAVVQGYGPKVGWADLAEAMVAIRGGARWVATNLDSTLPSTRGPLPGNGSLVAALSTALGGRRPDVVVGKPEPALFQVAARHHGAHRVLVVGDRLDTDIEGANRAGMDSLLVLTGVSTPADLIRAPRGQRPTYVATDLNALSTMEQHSRVPEWTDDGAAVNGWRVTRHQGQFVLSGEGEDVDALRALAAAGVEDGYVQANGPAAARTLKKARALENRPLENRPLEKQPIENQPIERQDRGRQDRESPGATSVSAA